MGRPAIQGAGRPRALMLWAYTSRRVQARVTMVTGQTIHIKLSSTTVPVKGVRQDVLILRVKDPQSYRVGDTLNLRLKFHRAGSSNTPGELVLKAQILQGR
ncbi:MAG: hypothetical protein HQ596_00895 [Candidatus Saganbacteria bacterium]|nr:hypothetical protein [Candidatus Saganbacteria bacterium]